MLIEHRITVAAPPSVVFDIYRAVDSWHTWDPDTLRAWLDGPFQVGSQGGLTPTQGRTVPMRVTVLEPDRRFTVECAIPLFRMTFEHELTPVTEGTQVVHRVCFQGLLAWPLGALLGGRINKGLPRTLANLKALAQSRAAARETHPQAQRSALAAGLA